MTREEWRRAACWVLAVPLLVAGCASERVTGLQRRTAAAQPGTSVPACPFSLGAIDDRRDAQSLGQMGRTHIDGVGFDEWFRAGIASIPGYTRDAAAPTLRITVLKAYVHGLITLKSANLVVRVQLPPDGSSAATTKTYRGFDDSINWSTSESEIQQAFDAALDNLTAQIGADLKKRCRA
ncbi:hypothetical protein [Variovorax sp. 160MFSha2.1]|uniref:hypothetical protein n=1 Tax=Variovorax sp. 160MFSha2.1 TaxID=3158367 RepID=UPI003AAD1A29